MRRISIPSLPAVFIAICTISASLAQSVSYLDRDYHPASERSYAYKRVIQFKEALVDANRGTDYWGRPTINPVLNGFYVCSLVDYFPSGQAAMVANVTTKNKNCSQWWFNGKVVYFYPSGHIRKTEFYEITKLQGDVITYAEDGRIVTKEHYEGGQPINTRKYAVAPNHPLEGKWKYVKYYDGSANLRSCCCGPNLSYCIERELLWTISSDGILKTEDLKFSKEIQIELKIHFNGSWRRSTGRIPGREAWMEVGFALDWQE